MAFKVHKTEHNGAKHGNGAHWGPKSEAKQGSSKLRRRNWKQEIEDGIQVDVEHDLAIAADWSAVDHEALPGLKKS